MLVRDRKLYVGNLGDSRAVLCRDRKAVELSKDHSTKDEAERARIKEDGGVCAFDGDVREAGRAPPLRLLLAPHPHTTSAALPQHFLAHLRKTRP